MLSENMRAIRKLKGLSQEELAIRLNEARQTISKMNIRIEENQCEKILKKLYIN